MQKVTIGIVSYKNLQWLEQAIASVLEQDYAALELIVSDDGTPDFDKEKIAAYIENNKSGNLYSYQVLESEINTGTVKNVNRVLKNATGDFILFFAADDMLAASSVVSEFVAEFERAGAEVGIITGQAKMCGFDLTQGGTNALQPCKGKYFNERSAREQFKALSFQCFYAAGATMYRKQTFETHGWCDERFFLVEDLSYWLKVTAAGTKLYYSDFTVLLHRDGGASHATGALSPAQKLFFEDYKRIYELLIFPYIDWFDSDEQKKLLTEHYPYFVHKCQSFHSAVGAPMPLTARIRTMPRYYMAKFAMAAQRKIAASEMARKKVVAGLLRLSVFSAIATVVLLVFFRYKEMPAFLQFVSYGFWVARISFFLGGAGALLNILLEIEKDIFTASDFMGL